VKLTVRLACPNQNDLMNALQSGVLRDQVNAAKAHLRQAGGVDGLDRIFKELQLDIIVAPGDAALSSLAAAAGMSHHTLSFEIQILTNYFRLPHCRSSPRCP